MQVFDFHKESGLELLILPENFFLKTLNLGSFPNSKGYIHLMRLVTLKKQFNAFASTFRIKSLLCCGAAVLLSACGGNIDAGGEQLSASAASVSTDAGAPTAASSPAPAAAVETVAEAAPVAGTEAAAVASNEAAVAPGAEPAPAAGTGGAATQAADVTAQAFELSGYDGTSPQTPTGQQDASAEALASIKQ